MKPQKVFAERKKKKEKKKGWEGKSLKMGYSSSLYLSFFLFKVTLRRELKE